jgi:putative flippase GtrA
MTRESALQFASYFFYAGIATVVDMSVLYALTEYGGFHYLQSAVGGYVCGMVTNYGLNKKYTFKNESTAYAKQFSVFVLVALVGLLLNQTILYGLVDLAHVWYMYAKVVAVGAVALWSFWGHRRLTFRIA